MRSRRAFFFRPVLRLLFALCVSALLLACSSTRPYTPEQWAQTIPNGTQVFRICRRHPLMPPDVRYWYVQEAGFPLRSLLPLKDLLESGIAQAVFIYDPYAPSESRKLLGLQYDKLPCDKPPPRPPPPPPPKKVVAKAETPQKTAQAKPAPRPVAAPSREKQGNPRPDPRYLAQSNPAPAPTPGMKAPDPPPPSGNTPAEQRANLNQRDAEAKARSDGERVGAAWGEVVGKATSALKTLDSLVGGTLSEVLQRSPRFAADLQKGLTQKLDAIPALPVYEDEKLAKIAFDGFLKGYGKRLDDAQLEASLVNGLATALLMLSPDGAVAAENAGANALRAAWQRIREMPIFVPVGLGGLGGVVRLSKAPAVAKAATAEATTTTVTTKVTPAKTAELGATKSAPSSPEAPRLKKDGTPAAKTGPKTDDTSPHNAAVIRERERLEAAGNRVIQGGRKPGSPEEVRPTPGGHKETRRPDITYVTPDGEMRSVNVGKTKKDGTPVKREQQALDDLNGPGKRPTEFVPYDR